MLMRSQRGRLGSLPPAGSPAAEMLASPPEDQKHTWPEHERENVDRLVLLRELRHRLEDLAVRREVEIVRLQVLHRGERRRVVEQKYSGLIESLYTGGDPLIGNRTIVESLPWP